MPSNAVVRLYAGRPSQTSETPAGDVRLMDIAVAHFAAKVRIIAMGYAQSLRNEGLNSSNLAGKLAG